MVLLPTAYGENERVNVWVVVYGVLQMMFKISWFGGGVWSLAGGAHAATYRQGAAAIHFRTTPSCQHDDCYSSCRSGATASMRTWVEATMHRCGGSWRLSHDASCYHDDCHSSVAAGDCERAHA